MPMDAMCMTMILPDQTAELSYSAADHLINPSGTMMGEIEIFSNSLLLKCPRLLYQSQCDFSVDFWV
jgi:hypothetical protein